jgi:prepilin-type N-terminal cleavage/methylation domain-containing protein
MTRHEVLADRESAPARDAGFTLVEVVWALFLLGIIAMASLGLFLKGMTSVAHMQRQQAAVSLANSAMDAARSVDGGATNATGTTKISRSTRLSASATA